MAYDTTELNAILADLNGLTEAEKMNIANLIFTETFSVKNIKDTHPTISEVRSGSKVPILMPSDDYGGFPFTEGDCTLPACDISDNWSTYTWNLGQIGCELTICMETFTNDFMAFFNTWKKMNSDDINSAVVQFIIERFQSRHLKAEIRVAYFGDTSSSDTLINGFDGFFAQMEAIADADNLVTITENAGATAEDQTITDGQALYDYLTEMYNKAVVQPWFDPDNMVWRMDRSLAMLLAGFLNTKSDLSMYNCDCIDPTKVTQARVFTWDNLAVFGIPIEPMPFLDAMKAIDELYDDADGTFVNRNRIILSRRENMIVGYEIEQTLKRFKVGYDEREDEIYIKGASLFGVGVPQDAFILATGAIAS